MKINEARAYISFNIKSGIWSPEMFEGWSDEKITKFAEYQMDRADGGANEYSD